MVVDGGGSQEVSPEVADLRRLAAQEWQSYLGPLMSITDRLLPLMSNPQDAQIRREFYRQVLSQMVSAFFGLLYADPQHPDLWPFVTPATAYAGGNPDHDYYMSPVDDGGVYRICGYRGTVRRIDLQIGTGTFFSRGVPDQNKLGLTLANHDFDQLDIGPDGAFEVLLSPQRPVGHHGNWWPLPPKSSYLLLRQTSYDWVNEADGRIAIERLDRAAAKPRPSAAQLEQDLRQLALWTESWMLLSIAFVREIYRDQGVNRIGYKDLREYGELLTQKYAYGGFDLAADEALLVEAEVPDKCRYWSVHLMDDHGFTLDWVNRQTHINGHSGVVDADGVFRAVISAQDPGVPNWLDTMGYRNGTVQLRWEECNRFPQHHVTKVKVAEVRQHLPATTPVVSAAARDEAIRARRRGAQWRKRW